MMLVYKIKRLCYDSNIFSVPPYEDNPTEDFDNFEDAWNFAVKLAKQEAEYLNSDCDEGIVFGIPRDEAYKNQTLCRVEYYYNDENNDTDNIEIVTKYWVYSENK